MNGSEARNRTGSLAYETSVVLDYLIAIEMFSGVTDGNRTHIGAFTVHHSGH